MRLRILLTVFFAGLRLSALSGDSTDFGAIVRQFSAERYKLDQDLSSRLNLPLPPQAESFFQVAVTGDMDSVSNSFEQLMPSGSYGQRIPGLNNQLWAPIHETLGLWEFWVDWKEDSSLLARFYEPVMSAIPEGSIYFGGTDYGRFVITAVNALKDVPPLFVLTQNALADDTYVSHLRAVYGDQIWIPSKDESAGAFHQYVAEVKSGKRAANADLSIKDGKVTVSGAMGVMEINGIICEMIFEHNKGSHDFFVEESYVIPWMNPYLEPHGLILKLNKEPIDHLSDEVVARDRVFWKDYEATLNGESSFADNREAKKAFSKLRSAIAGLYAYRKMYAEAEDAFRQAVRLCPGSPESNFRLAQMLEEQGRTKDAADVMTTFVESDPPDVKPQAEAYLRRLMDKLSDNESGM